MSTPSKHASAKKRSPKKNEDQQRVILLLDMDCFYAQCETVRLGLDRELPLALIQVIILSISIVWGRKSNQLLYCAMHMQWNSALAVSYPAVSQTKFTVY